MSQDWRVAKSLEKILAQVNAAYPDRDKTIGPDGTVASDEHRKQNPKSDHEVDRNGVVKAMDISHDPHHGFDSYKFADWLISQKDPRLRYVISNKRIAGNAEFARSNPNIVKAPWTWAPYHGPNDHDHHVHLSASRDATVYDQVQDWDIGPTMQPDTSHPPAPQVTILRRGSHGKDVEELQRLLHMDIDGDFGRVTEMRVKNFQKALGLVADGVVGRKTWEELRIERPAATPDIDDAISAPSGVPTSSTTTPEQRLQMAKSIVDYEARRDQKTGHLMIYNLPPQDGGGRFEVAGINEKYNRAMLMKLVALVRAGKYDEAENEAVEFIADDTDAAAAWTNSPAVEFYLRDTMFNRGPRGAARILQRAVGVPDDGKVGAITLAAAARMPPAALLTRLRAAREDYERDVIGYRAIFWRGLSNRWNGALQTAERYLPDSGSTRMA